MSFRKTILFLILCSTAWPIHFSDSLMKPMLGRRPLNLAKFPFLPVAMYVMNEGTGSRVNDLSGNRNTMNLLSDAPWKPAKFGMGVDFTAVADMGEVTNSPSIEISGDQSGIIWVRFDTLEAATDQRLMCKRDAGGTQFEFYVDSTNYLMFYDGSNVRTFNAGLVVDTWYQLSFTVKNDVVTLYKNLTSQSYSASLTANDANLRVGSFYTNSRPILGIVDHVIFFDVGLTAQQIAYLYRNPWPWFAPRTEWWGGTITIPTGVGQFIFIQMN